MTKLQQVKEFNTVYGITGVNQDWFVFEDKSLERSIELPGRPTKMWKDTIKRFFSNKWNAIAFAVFIGLVLLIVIGALTAPYAKNERVLAGNVTGSQNIAWLAPTLHGVPTVGTTQIMSVKDFNLYNAAHPGVYTKIADMGAGFVKVSVQAPSALQTNILLGTESHGYDIWSQIMHGSAFSLWLAFAVATIETIVGVWLGVYIGFHAGKTLDTIVMRFVDTFSNIPSLIFMIIIVAALPKTILTLMISMLITGWIGPVYSSRIFVIQIKDREFIAASKLSGASKMRQIFAHALPNIAGKLTVNYVHRIPAVIFAEASIFMILGNSFLTGQVSLGTLIQDAQQGISLSQFHIWYLLLPVLIMCTLTISLQIIANGFRDAMDPRVSA